MILIVPGYGLCRKIKYFFIENLNLSLLGREIFSLPLYLEILHEVGGFKIRKGDDRIGQVGDRTSE